MRFLFITQPGDGHLNPLVPLNAIATVLASDSHRNAVRALRAEAKVMPSTADAVDRLVAMTKV